VTERHNELDDQFKSLPACRVAGKNYQQQSANHNLYSSSEGLLIKTEVEKLQCLCCSCPSLVFERCREAGALFVVAVAQIIMLCWPL